MDGLLVDSEALYLQALTETATARRLPFSRELYVGLVGYPGPECARRLGEHYGPEFPIDEFWETSGERARELARTQGARLKPGVAELFLWLEASAIPRALCTSSQRVWVDQHLGRHGLISKFTAVVTGGDCARHKPHPEPYLMAADRLGVAPQDCLALEDSHNGVRSATAAGMMTVMVPDMLEATDEMRGLCLHVAEDLHQVRALMDAHGGAGTKFRSAG